MRVLGLATVLGVALVASGFGVPIFQFGQYEEGEMDKMKELERSVKLERYLPKTHFDTLGNFNNSRLRGFKFKDCGSWSYPADISYVRLTPDPLRIPGRIGVSFRATNSKAAQAKVTIWKSWWWWWIKAPCYSNNVGSCTYSDICKWMPQNDCPRTFVRNNIPCKCPLPKGTFSLPLTYFTVDVTNVPNGLYSVKAVLKSPSGPLACLEMELSVK